MTAVSILRSGFLPTVTLEAKRGLLSGQSFRQICIAVYPSLQNLGVLSFGLKELVLDVLLPKYAKKKSETLSLAEMRVQKAVQDTLPHLNGSISSKLPKKELILHGLIFAQSGVCGLGAVAHRHRFISFGSLGRFLDPISRLYFLLGNLLSLSEAVRRLNLSHSLKNASDPATLQQLKRMKYSALIGILATIDCILLTLISFLGFTSGVIFFMAGVTAVTGSLQVLYDMFFLPAHTF